jgi:hypothetical protein
MKTSGQLYAPATLLLGKFMRCSLDKTERLGVVHILEVPGSTSGPEASYIDYVYRGSAQFLQENSGLVPQIKPQLLASTSFPIHFSPITLPPDII